MSITRNPSLNSFPLTKTGNNQLNFLVSMDERPIDMASSYVELEVDIPALSDKHNVSLGHDGYQYEPSCFFRNVQLEDSGRGKLAHTNYINILNENLKYIATSENDKLSEAIYNGAAHPNPNAEGVKQHELVSVFNNEYPDLYPTIRVPVSSLIKGELSESLYQQKGDLTLRTILEPSYPLLQRAVEAQAYNGTVAASGVVYNIQDTVGNDTTLITQGITVIPADLDVNQYALIVGEIDGVLVSSVRKMTAIGATAPNFQITLDQAVSASVDVFDNILIQGIVDTHEIQCNDLSASGSVLTLKTGYSSLKDIRKTANEATRIKVNYMVYDEDSQVVVMESVERTVSSLSIVSQEITTITLDSQLVLPAGAQKLIFISVEPLYTNLDSFNWQIMNSHLVLYRRNQKVKEGKQMLVSSFESAVVQCVANLDRFVYRLPALNNNTFNAYVFTPTSTNMISQRQNFSSYLISVDELQLTSIYLETDSVLHKENVLRVFSNSPTEKPMNLKTNRDYYIAKTEDIKQTVITGKVFSSMLGGEMNVQPMGQNRTLKIDLEATPSTTQTNIYIFSEKWMAL